MGFRRLQLDNKARGDTIIEVVMSVAIVSAVITGSYALAGNSLQEGISATEHTAATKLIEGQIEALKLRKHNTLPADWNTNFVTTQDFCLDTTVPSQYNLDGTLATRWLPISNSDPTNLDRTGALPGYASYCTDPSAGTAKYFINIRASTSPIPTYQFTVRWIPPGNGSTNQLQMYYRF